MNPSKNKKHLIIGLLVLLTFLFLKKRHNLNSDVVPVTAPIKPRVSQTAVIKLPETTGKKVEEKIISEPIVLASQIVSNFERNAKLKFPPELKSLQYENLEFDDASDTGIMGIIAKDQMGGISFAFIASKQGQSPESIKNFIQNEVATFLKVSFTPEVLENPEVSIPDPETGFAKITLWILTNNDSISVVSHVTRLDGQFTYLSILNGSKSIILNNEVILENLLQNIKPTY